MLGLFVSDEEKRLIISTPGVAVVGKKSGGGWRGRNDWRLEPQADVAAAASAGFAGRVLQQVVEDQDPFLGIATF